MGRRKWHCDTVYGKRFCCSFHAKGKSWGENEKRNKWIPFSCVACHPMYGSSWKLCTSTLYKRDTLERTPCPFPWTPLFVGYEEEKMVTSWFFLSRFQHLLAIMWWVDSRKNWSNASIVFCFDLPNFSYYVFFGIIKVSFGINKLKQTMQNKFKLNKRKNLK